MTKAGIVVLNYNGWQDTIECVKGLANVKYPKLIIVVDNCSSDDSYEELRKRLKQNVVLLKSTHNLGYAGGNNIGLRYALDKGCEYLCILNNDTIIEEDFLTPCIKELEEHSDTGFVGPTLIDYSTGLVQSTGGEIFIDKGKVTQKNRNVKYDMLQARIECDYVGGACIVLRSEYIRQIGFIPECYFLFFEETEWCYRSLKKGYKNICLGKTCIKHKGSVSIKRTVGLNEYLLNRNRIVFLRRNSNTWCHAFIIYMMLVAKNIVRFIAGRRDAISNIKAYHDGWNNKVDLKKYPFIVIKE